MKHLTGCMLMAVLWLAGCGPLTSLVQPTTQPTRTPGVYIIPTSNPSPTPSATPEPQNGKVLTAWLKTGALPKHLLFGAPGDPPPAYPAPDTHVYIPLQYLEDKTVAGDVEAIFYEADSDADAYISHKAGDDFERLDEEGYRGQEGVFLAEGDGFLYMITMKKDPNDEARFFVEIDEMWFFEQDAGLVVSVKLQNKADHLSPARVFDWSVDFLNSLGDVTLPD